MYITNFNLTITDNPRMHKINPCVIIDKNKKRCRMIEIKKMIDEKK